MCACDRLVSKLRSIPTDVTHLPPQVKWGQAGWMLVFGWLLSLLTFTCYCCDYCNNKGHRTDQEEDKADAKDSDV